MVSAATKWTGLVALLLAAALGIRLYLYLEGAAHIPVTTDEAITVLHAVDIRAGNYPLLMMAQPYMFPLEAYWMAPFVDLLPRNAYGMRALVLAEGFVFVVLSLLLLRRMGPWQRIWPGALLVLFPSVYLSANQNAYSLPHNHSAYILALTAALFIFSLNREPRKGDVLQAASGGFFAIMAFSNAMLSLSLIVPLVIIALWNATGRGRWIRLPGYAAGASIGILPYMAATWLIPGAHASVTATRPWGEALKRLWSPTLEHTLPVVFGWKATAFPDHSTYLEWGKTGYALFPYAFVVLIVLAVLLVLVRLVSALRQRTRYDLGGLEWAIGASVLCITLFLLSMRASHSAYRYLVPLLVVFPFLIAGLMTALPSRLRPILAAFSIVVAIGNIGAAVKIPSLWKAPGFAVDVVSAPDLELAIDFLKEHGIRHAVASHWASYRIAFDADGAITCSQPQNERFPGWPVPYKDEVDAATNVAYVLTDEIRFLKPGIFERHLRTMGVTAEVHTAGYFRIYHRFSSPAYEREQRIQADRINVTASEAAENAAQTIDGSRETFWRSASLQHTNLWIECAFAEPVNLSRVLIDYGRFSHDRPSALRVEVRTAEGWTVVADHLKQSMDKFVWHLGKPVYGRATESVWINRPAVEAIRIGVANPRPDWCWTITELEAFEHP